MALLDLLKELLETDVKEMFDQKDENATEETVRVNFEDLSSEEQQKIVDGANKVSSLISDALGIDVGEFDADDFKNTTHCVTCNKEGCDCEHSCSDEQKCSKENCECSCHSDNECGVRQCKKSVSDRLKKLLDEKREAERKAAEAEKGDYDNAVKSLAAYIIRACEGLSNGEESPLTDLWIDSPDSGSVSVKISQEQAEGFEKYIDDLTFNVDVKTIVCDTIGSKSVYLNKSTYEVGYPYVAYVVI